MVLGIFKMLKHNDLMSPVRMGDVDTAGEKFPTALRAHRAQYFAKSFLSRHVSSDSR